MSSHVSRFGWGLVGLLLLAPLPAWAQPAQPAPDGLPPLGSTLPCPAPEPAASPSAEPVLPTEAPSENEDEPAGAFLFTADYLLLKARTRPLDFAIVGTNRSDFGPQGDVRSLNWNTASGFRVGAGYRLPGEGWEAGFNYTYFHDNANDLAGRPAGGSLFPTLTHPGMVEVADSALADAKLNYNVYDVEVGKHFHPSEALDVRAFAGPRFATIGLENNAYYNGGDARNDHVHSRIDFNGGGLRMGAEGQWSIWKGLGLYARGGASLMSGTFRSTLTETTNSGASTLVNVTDRFHKMVPVAELGLGVSWKYRNWRVSAGYELVNWFGAVDSPDFVDDSHLGKMSRRTGDLGLEGLVLRAELEF